MTLDLDALTTPDARRSAELGLGIDIEEQLQALAAQAMEATGLRGTTAIAAWTHFAETVRTTVSQMRALEAADLVYLHGWRLREVANEVAGDGPGGQITHQGVNNWLSTYGPKHYVTVAEDGSVHIVPVTGLVQTRRELGAARQAGRRVAPSKWRIAADSPFTRVSGKFLWRRIGE